MTLTFKIDVERVKKNQHTKCVRVVW